MHLAQSRTDEAIIWLEKASNSGLQRWYAHANLAAALALKGESQRAATELAAARRLVKDDRLSSIARLKAAGMNGGPKVRALLETTYLAGLRKAGVPEE